MNENRKSVSEFRDCAPQKRADQMQPEQMQPVRGVVFDMDGLIFDSERIVQRAWYETGKRTGYPDLGDHIFRTIGFNRARRKVYFKGVYGEDFPHEEIAELARACFVEITEREGMPVKKGAAELLEFLHGRGIRIGLATSSSEDHAKNALVEADLFHFFDGCVYGNMIVNSKPDPEIYLKACEAIGVKPAEALALEDAPSGIEAAQAAGMRPVMVPDLVEPDEETRSRAWRIEKDLTAVKDFLENMI